MNNKGLAFIFVISIILVLAIGAAAFLTFGKNEIYTARRRIESTKAFYIAQAGLNRALYDLKEEFETDDQDWNDGDINSIDVTSVYSSSNFYIIPYSPTLLGDGTYTVSLKNVGATTGEIWVKSSGTVGSITRTIQVYAKAKNISPWNNAIFAGAGSSGATISGNVDIRGSIHILGTGLDSTDTAISLSGTASIGNNYSGIPTELSSRIPDCPQVTFGSETVDSLSAEFRVKKGRADLSGSAEVGESNKTGNSLKETVDGVYVNVGPDDGDNQAGTYYDGFGGNKGAGNVSSDNGTTNAYDLGDAASFPSLDDSYGASTYRQYLVDNSFAISENDLSSITSSTSDYSEGDSKGSLTWDPDYDSDGNPATKEGLLTISGIVRITDGEGALGEISIGEKNLTIEYTGSGTIFADDIEIHGDLLSQGTFPSTDYCLSLIADNNINLATGSGDSQFKMTGVFYAEGQITSAKQNEIAGTFVSNYFDMGSNVPSIYHIPDLMNHLPDHMTAWTSDWAIITSNWQEI